jgi:hypothetical protein
MNRFYKVIIFLCCITNLFAQFEPPKVSPHATVSQTFGFTTITIDYHRPSVHERKIWGGLVAFGKVWRTGANDATTIQFSTDVKIEGNKIPAGIYSLFTIPEENEWTVILNNQTKISGLDYNPAFDFTRFKVKPAQSRFVEQLQYSFAEATDMSCQVYINWENLQITFKIENDLLNEAYRKMKEAIATKPQDASVYNDCIKYAADKEMFLNEALQWADKSILYGGGYVAYYYKARVLFALKKYNDALNAIDTCRDKGRNEKDYDSFVTLLDFLEKQIKSAVK